MKIRLIPLLLLLTPGVAHAQPPPEAQALVLDKQIIGAIESGDHAAAAQSFAKRKAVDIPVPPPLQIEMAKVYYALGDYLAAHDPLAEDLSAATPEYLAALTAPGRVFRDCDVCPEMVLVPAGSFMMGSPSSEEGRYDNEGPVHQVTIARPFAVGVYEVTFAEWDACVADGGCGGYSPSDWGWGRGTRPVIHVSWDHAQSYLDWLSDKTGESYRLLSESEWEYAARAGTTTPFHTGSTISTEQANYNGNYTYGSGAAGVYRGQTVAVGSFPANGFGLHDVHGNVWEWVQDCWDGSYRGAPDDGSAWESGDCSRRMLRGGPWGSRPGILRSANRGRYTPGTRYGDVGFRVARTLTP